MLNIFNPCVKFQQDVCKFAKDNVDGSSVMSLFYASGIGNYLGNCKVCIAKHVDLRPFLSATGNIVK